LLKNNKPNLLVEKVWSSGVLTIQAMGVQIPALSEYLMAEKNEKKDSKLTPNEIFSKHLQNTLGQKMLIKCW